MNSIESTESVEFERNIFCKKAVFEPSTTWVTNQDATTPPRRHMLEKGSLKWTLFMLQWFIRFPEFAEFTESSTPFRKNSNKQIWHFTFSVSLFRNCLFERINSLYWYELTRRCSHLPFIRKLHHWPFQYIVNAQWSTTSDGFFLHIWDLGKIWHYIFTFRNIVAARLCFHRRLWFCSQGGGCLPHCMLGHHPLPGPGADTPLPGPRSDTSQADTPQQMATAADGMHPTRMHSCPLNLQRIQEQMTHWEISLL